MLKGMLVGWRQANESSISALCLHRLRCRLIASPCIQGPLGSAGGSAPGDNHPALHCSDDIPEATEIEDSPASCVSCSAFSYEGCSLERKKCMSEWICTPYHIVCVEWLPVAILLAVSVPLLI